jgi:hypothetical protein
VQSSVQPDGQFIRLFTATLNSSIYSNPKSVPSSGGFVFVATATVAQTQNNEASLKSVQSSVQPDGQFIRLFTATLNPSRHPDGPSFFWVGLFLW